MQIKDIVWPEKYNNPHNEEKTRWHNCGVLFIKDDGKISIKLTMLPVCFDGNLVVFDRKPKEQAQPQYNTPPSEIEFDGNIPF